MHKAGSRLVSKEVRGSPSCTPALPLPHPNTSTLMSRVGGEQRMRHQSPYGWREPAKLCPSKPSGRGARLPCPGFMSLGEWGADPEPSASPSSPWGSPTWRPSLCPHSQAQSLWGLIHPTFIYQIFTAHHKVPGELSVHKHSMSVF